jgi:hypothetical protein
MKLKRILFLFGVFFILLSFPGYTKDGRLPSEFLKYEGRHFKGMEDPEFQQYDLALRDYLSKHLQKHYGIEVDPKAFSSFDLLELEALVKCKKQGESLDAILKLFPRPRPSR